MTVVGWKDETSVQKMRGYRSLTRVRYLEKSVKKSVANRKEQRTEALGATKRFWRLLEKKFQECKL